MARAIDGDELELKIASIAKLAKSDAQKALMGRVLYCVEKMPVLAMNDHFRDVTNMPTLTLPNEWVSVEERLPEESDGMVLFTNGKAVTSGYRNHMFRMSGEEGVYAPAIRKGGGYMRVTHWMHLPAPPDRRPPEGET